MILTCSRPSAVNVHPGSRFTWVQFALRNRGDRRAEALRCAASALAQSIDECLQVERSHERRARDIAERAIGRHGYPPAALDGDDSDNLWELLSDFELEAREQLLDDARSMTRLRRRLTQKQQRIEAILSMYEARRVA